MLVAPPGAWAARLGDREPSARLFQEGYADFVDEPFLVTNEFSRRFPAEARAGPLMANVGGFLTSLLYGLTGLVLGPEEPTSWARRPAVMPALWTASRSSASGHAAERCVCWPCTALRRAWSCTSRSRGLGSGRTPPSLRIA